MKFNDKYTIGKNVVIGKNVKIGDGAMIFDNVVLADNVIVCDNCTVGEPANGYYRDPNYVQAETFIGEGSLLRSHTVVYSGTKTGVNFQTGHRATIREGSIFGDHCSVGTSSDVQGDSTFGNYCRLHSNVFIAQYSKLGNFVFVYPHVIFTNDPTPPSEEHQGPEVADYAQISTNSVLLPGIKVGEHALVAASSVVSRDVEAYSLVAGNPAKHFKDVREIKSRKTGEPHYPWPNNFTHRMPWAEIGYEEWFKNQ